MCLSSNYCPWDSAVATVKDTNMHESVFPPGTHHPTDQNLRLCWFRHLHPSLATQLSYPQFWVFWRVLASLPKAAFVIVDSHLCLHVGAQTHVILTCFPSLARGTGWPAFPPTCTWRWRCMLHLTRHHRPLFQGFCNALNKRFLLKCLAPTRSITPMIPSVWISNPLPDWLT